MSFLFKVFQEPLTHFVLIGAAVFGLYALLSEDEIARDKIVVTDGRIEQLAQVFTKTWQRPPTSQELRGLVEAFVKEEVYYREAIKLGLDRDDTLIRRRMQQKMEFLTEPDDADLQVNDATLKAYLEENKTQFQVEPRFAFEQVFLNPDKSADAPARAEQALAILQTSAPGPVPSAVGDPTLLPPEMPLSSFSEIARNFGEAFAANLTDLPESQWSGPINSSYGLHLVRITSRIDGYHPELSKVRDAVEKKWRAEKRDAFQARAYEKLLAQYDVVLPDAADRAEARP